MDGLRRRAAAEAVGALGAAVILGVAWAAWHVVPWSQTHEATWVAWHALATVALRVLIFWVFCTPGGSVLAAAVAVVLLWGPRTLARFRCAASGVPAAPA